MDYIMNGSAHGGVASALLQNDMNPLGLRPFLNDENPNDPRSYVDDGNGNAVVANANASLLRLEWTLLDETVMRAALPRLRAVADVRARGLQFTIPNGMSKTVLQSQAQSDINPANMSMDGLSESPGDRPVYNLTSLPLPIIHKDFSFSAREIAVSRNGNMPLDLSMAELAARRVAEAAEQLLIGVAPTYQYGGGSIYGFCNFPGATTYALHDPAASGWVARTTLLDILAMRTLSQLNLHYGPWVLYVSLAWDQYLDDDLSIYKGDLTLRDRIRRIQGIDDVVTLDYLNGYDMVLVQMSSDVLREVVGMDITTVQWESHGGMQLNFKVMCILVPQLRTDFNGNTGIIYAFLTRAGSKVVTPPLNEQLLPSGNP